METCVVGKTRLFPLGRGARSKSSAFDIPARIDEEKPILNCAPQGYEDEEVSPFV